MKTININGEGDIMTVTIMADPTDRQPCWYANFKNSDERANAEWVVGMKSRDKKDEYLFKASSIGDITNDTLWAYITSPDFAIGLVESFKRGGELEANLWVKNATT